MKVIILAGGFGTRLAEETDIIPKPMVEIGGKPILWHIMKHYGHFGFKEFNIALGYKQELIKDFFLNYHYLTDSLTVDTKSGEITKHNKRVDDWIVHLVDTGLETMTGGRVKRVAKQLGNETFMMTYGDAVSNLNLKELVRFHCSHGKLATVTAIQPPARFGALVFDGDKVIKFAEKPKIGESWINGGFFVLEPEVVNYIDGDDTSWEREPLERLANEGELMAYRHDGFWQCMDNIRDLRYLRNLWAEDNAAWKLWGD
ncbi:MAG: glucose-1-phosphate cytidylyltransferase [Methanobacteriaceae archaeon]|jgi:glucose-1-phosphate cytidylyltransferase